MANKRTVMEKIREIVRMSEKGISKRGIAKALRVSRPVVSEYLTKIHKANLGYSDLVGMNDDGLLNIIKNKRPASNRYEILTEKFEYFLKELKRTGVTLQLLWEEYIIEHPDGYRRAQFTHHFRQWKKNSNVTMHIEHKAGDKMFVDFTGQKMNIIDARTGEIQEVEIFVAILGGSGLTYALATVSQRKEDWIKANENALHYYGGIPRAIVPDCLRSAITKGCRYEPDINPDYFNFAEHYGTTILAARPYHPRDKALAENAVRLIYQRVFAPLRNEIFHTLEELNLAIATKLEDHNSRPQQKMKISRRQLFEEIEQDVLQPLPAALYEFKHFEQAKAQFNYHVFLKEDRHYYSVPYRYKGCRIRLIYGDSTVELYHKNMRIAIHKRNRKQHDYTTNREHMPSHHRYIAEWNPERILKQAAGKGTHVRELVMHVLNSRKHPEQAFKSCQGILHLSDRYGIARLDRACRRTVAFGNYSYRSVKNILQKGLDKIQEQPVQLELLPLHENIRGEDYYG